MGRIIHLLSETLFKASVNLMWAYDVSPKLGEKKLLPHGSVMSDKWRNWGWKDHRKSAPVKNCFHRYGEIKVVEIRLILGHFESPCCLFSTLHSLGENLRQPIISFNKEKLIYIIIAWEFRTVLHSLQLIIIPGLGKEFLPPPWFQS